MAVIQQLSHKRKVGSELLLAELDGATPSRNKGYPEYKNFQLANCIQFIVKSDAFWLAVLQYFCVQLGKYGET